MDTLSTIFIIFTASPLLFILIILFYLTLKTYTGKSIKNPNYAPVYGTVFSQLFYLDKLYDYQTQAARKHMTFRLIGPDHSELFTADPRNVEHILKTKFNNYSKGKHAQDLLFDFFGEGIVAVDGEEWKQQRKLASIEFSAKVSKNFGSSVFKGNAAKLVRLISGIAITDRVFDIQDILMRWTLDSVYKVGFGVDLNCLEGSNQDGVAFMKAIDDASALIYLRLMSPFWKVKKYFNIGSEASLKKNMKVVHAFVNSLISAKRKQLALEGFCNDKQDIISRFLTESEKNPNKTNDKYLRDIILDLMIAGKDSIANTLSWFLYLICKNPIVQEKIVHEVVHVTGSQDVEANVEDFLANITDTVLEQMHYLHAALTETLRSYPAVPLNGRRAEADDILPDGFRVKEGDGVCYMSYAMGRMSYLWGEDAEDFRPERWLDNGIFRPESPFKFVSFHAGPRMCLGKDFAYRQMKIATMALLRFFRFKLADESANATYRIMIFLHMHGGLHVRAIPRTTRI